MLLDTLILAVIFLTLIWFVCRVADNHNNLEAETTYQIKKDLTECKKSFQNLKTKKRFWRK